MNLFINFLTGDVQKVSLTRYTWLLPHTNFLEFIMPKSRRFLMLPLHESIHRFRTWGKLRHGTAAWPWQVIIKMLKFSTQRCMFSSIHEFLTVGIDSHSIFIMFCQGCRLNKKIWLPRRSYCHAYFWIVKIMWNFHFSSWLLFAGLIIDYIIIIVQF